MTVANGGVNSNGFFTISGGSNATFNGSAVTDNRTLSGTAGSTAGVFNGTVTLMTSGEGLGGESPSNVPVRYSVQVYSGKAEWIATTGLWADTNWKDTVGGGPCTAPGLEGYASDTATFGSAVEGALSTWAWTGLRRCSATSSSTTPLSITRFRKGWATRG